MVNAEDPLAVAVLRGDRDAIERFWEDSRRWVAAVILTYKPSFEDLDDLLQEVALTFVSKVNTVRGSGNVRAWLRTVAVNAARAAGRRGKYRPRPHAEDQLDAFGDGAGPQSVAEALGRDEDTRLMLERVERLPEGYREPLMLRAMHGLRSREIGEILEIPPQTVDTRVARARRMLREQRAATGNDGDPHSLDNGTSLT
ncbi:MAG: sigma-70 family RNA polymerase sigma factor [Planctomycetes bacterium]|nr:sigma-70 family RNA polymerase sigma factor [Planctomycetota bacterium]